MGRPEQHGKTEKGKKLQGTKNKGEVVEGRHKAGGFAEGNSHGKGMGERKSKGMLLRNALRDQLGEDKIRKLTDAVYEIAMGSEQETKDRLKAVDLLLGYAVGKANTTSALEVSNDGQGATTVRFVTVDERTGDEQEL